jgi:hypothetical protein
MQVVITVALTVEVPEGTDVGSLYLDLPTDQIGVYSLNDDRPVGATVEGYETLDVCGEKG